MSTFDLFIKCEYHEQFPLALVPSWILLSLISILESRMVSDNPKKECYIWDHRCISCFMDKTWGRTLPSKLWYPDDIYGFQISHSKNIPRSGTPFLALIVTCLLPLAVNAQDAKVLLWNLQFQPSSPVCFSSAYRPSMVENTWISGKTIEQIVCQPQISSKKLERYASHTPVQYYMPFPRRYKTFQLNVQSLWPCWRCLQ